MTADSKFLTPAENIDFSFNPMGLFVCRCGQAEDAAEYDNVKSYEGESTFGKRHGKGAYYYPNGDMFDGEWKWGKKHGYGVYTYANGIKKKGFFYEDNYVGENPGYLFAEEMPEDDDPARPLNPSNNEVDKIKSPTVEDILREKETEIAARREKNRKRREELRLKYDLRGGNTSKIRRTAHQKDSPRKRLLGNSKSAFYESV